MYQIKSGNNQIWSEDWKTAVPGFSQCTYPPNSAILFCETDSRRHDSLLPAAGFSLSSSSSFSHVCNKYTEAAIGYEVDNVQAHWVQRSKGLRGDELWWCFPHIRHQHPCELVRGHVRRLAGAGREDRSLFIILPTGTPNIQGVLVTNFPAALQWHLCP